MTAGIELSTRSAWWLVFLAGWTFPFAVKAVLYELVNTLAYLGFLLPLGWFGSNWADSSVVFVAMFGLGWALSRLPVSNAAYLGIAVAYLLPETSDVAANIGGQLINLPLPDPFAGARIGPGSGTLLPHYLNCLLIGASIAAAYAIGQFARRRLL